MIKAGIAGLGWWGKTLVEGVADSKDIQFVAGSARNHTDDIKAFAKQQKFELYKSPNGEYRWRLKATNGQVIATGGEGYSSKAAAQNGIESVKRSAADASVEEV